MNKTDVPGLSTALTKAFLAYGRNPPNAEMLTAYFEVLQEFAMADVLRVIGDWPKTQPKSPTAAELYKLLNDRAIDGRERQAERDRAEFAQGYRKLGASPAGKAALKSLADSFRDKQRMTMQSIAFRIMDQWCDGITPNQRTVAYVLDAGIPDDKVHAILNML